MIDLLGAALAAFIAAAGLSAAITLAGATAPKQSNPDRATVVAFRAHFWITLSSGRNRVREIRLGGIIATSGDESK